MAEFETAIIGAGPAGIAATIQLQRFGIRTVIFERNQIGGLLINANLIENYPGFPNGITGKRLVGLMEKHLNRSDSEIHFEAVVKVEYVGSDFIIQTTENEFKCGSLVIASGTKPRKLAISGLDSSNKDRVFYEVHPITDCENRRIAIIGAGDAAFDYALNLAENNEVSVSNRSDKRVCLPLLWHRTKSNSNIEYRENCLLKDVQLKEKQLNLNWIKNKDEFSEEVDYLLIAIGREPNIDFIDENFLLKSKDLKKNGLLHFVGDVKNGNFRQTSIAAGQGTYAAMALHQTLKRKS